MYNSIIDIISVFFFTILIVYLYKKNFAIFTVLLLILFSFIWRLISSLYLDLNKVYAVELFKYIGGKYFSSFFLCLYYILVILAFLLVFRRKNIYYMNKKYKIKKIVNINILHIGTFLIALFLFFLYVNLLKSGNIPLFTGIERYIYKVQYSNFFLKNFLIYQTFIFMAMGILFVYYKLENNRIFIKMILIIFIMYLLYLILIGNKFSALFLNICFFLIPISLLIFLGYYKNINLFSKKIIYILIMVLLFYKFIMYILIDLRGYEVDYAFEYLKHRILVQQAQLWWSGYERCFIYNNFNSLSAIDKVFIEPIKIGNTSLFYLMEKELGDYVYIALAKGSQYTGAFPIIYAEIFGPIISYFIIFLMSLILASLIKLFFKLILLQKYFSMLSIMFLFQPIYLSMVSGKLIFLTLPFYYVKIILFLLIFIFENYNYRRS